MQDTILSLFTGIYTTRIDPNEAQAYIDRDVEKTEEDRIKAEKEAKQKEMMDRYIVKYHSSE